MYEKTLLGGGKDKQLPARDRCYFKVLLGSGKYQSSACYQPASEGACGVFEEACRIQVRQLIAQAEEPERGMLDQHLFVIKTQRREPELREGSASYRILHSSRSILLKWI